MDDWDEVAMLTRNKPNKNEQRALGGFIAEADVDPSTYEFIQTEVPLGLQRVANAFSIEINSDRSRDDILSERYDGKPIGFPTAKDISQNHGFGRQAYTSSADLIMVRDTTIDIFEVKTRNERIEGVNDIHEAFGQLVMYLDRFSEDFPTLVEEYTLRGAVLAEDSELDIELLEASFIKRNLGYFDPLRGGFLLQMGSVNM
ncbi:hypothetical protein SAMN05216388_101860 [Halorientalis persicus]|uniref:Uncharacterized protein n=1 Tax=Halorientalis persicus TaxID=1367881 RepID=A0A1H8SB16_9EURY|nr:hypothetical protein [Halorientalis persicus]SEO75851.1 hypothetical protein SAMN05216388_101860 [Halorientalis persicus]